MSGYLKLQMFRGMLAGIAIGLTACGGGGGGGGGAAGGMPATQAPSTETGSAGDAIHVTLDPSSLSGTYIANDQNSAGPTPLLVKATLSSTPSGPVYPVIVDPQSALKVTPGQQPATQGADGSYSILLEPRGAEAAVVRKGTLTLRLCKDSACAAEYPLTGATLPYEFVFTDALSVAMKVDGVAVDDIRGNHAVTSGKTFEITVRDGAALELTSSIPVTWRAVVAGTANATVMQTASTPTGWQGTVSGSTPSGYVGITATPIDTRQVAANFQILVH